VEANMVSNGNQSSASGPAQAQILTTESKIWYVNGVCPGETPGQNGVSTSVNGSNIGLTLNQGGNVLGGSGVLNGTTITGNYSVTGSKCPNLIANTNYPSGFDSGGFVGNQVPDLGGTFSGSLNLANGTVNAAFALTENTDRTLTVSAQLKGLVTNGAFTFTGSAVGNVMFVSGSVDGQTLSLFGYFDRTGQFTGSQNSMLVFDYETLSAVGLLLKQ
jgi:hypothetical protein